MSALSPRQKLFVENFLITGNATQSAKEAGYAPSSAGEQGCKLLRNPLVTKEINEAERLRSYRLKLAQDYELLKALEILEYALEPKKRYTQKGEPMTDPETGEYVTTKDVNGALNALNFIAKIRGKFLTDIITAHRTSSDYSGKTARRLDGRRTCNHRHGKTVSERSPNLGT